jgi:hypothetical protein
MTTPRKSTGTPEIVGKTNHCVIIYLPAEFHIHLSKTLTGTEVQKYYRIKGTWEMPYPIPCSEPRYFYTV